MWNRTLIRTIKAGLLITTLSLLTIAIRVTLGSVGQDEEKIRSRSEPLPRLQLDPNIWPGESAKQAQVTHRTTLEQGSTENPVIVQETKENEQQSADDSEHDESLSRGLYRIRGYPNDIFLLSVVIWNSSVVYPKGSIFVQGLGSPKYNNASFACCLKYDSGHVVSINVTTMLTWAAKSDSKLTANQYVCPGDSRRSDLPVAVTLAKAAKQSECHQRSEWYLKPNYGHARRQKTAVCTKIVHNKTDAGDLFSWFEVYRKLGVEKFVAYTHNLNPNADSVLKYYKNRNIVETQPFTFPKLGDGHMEFGEKLNEKRTMEQTFMYDCLERMRGYKYLLVLDVDEFLIPNKAKNLTQLFDNLWKTKPTAAAFSFLYNLHITSWNAGNKKSQLTARRYTDRTSARDDAMRHVTRPDMLRYGGLTTRSFMPKGNVFGFRVPVDEAIVHHFRSCDKSTDWQKEMDKTCPNMERVKDMIVADMLKAMETEIIKLKDGISKKRW